MASKHTPAPWTTHKGSLTGAVWAGNDFIASVYPNAPEDWDGKSEWGSVDEMRANALLVAAAPDLLEALRNLCEVSGRSRNISAAREKAREAIAKAEGRA